MRSALVIFLLHAAAQGAAAQRRWTIEVDNDAFNVQSIGPLRAHLAGAASDEEYTHGTRLILPRSGRSPIARLMPSPIPACDTRGETPSPTRSCQSWRLVLAQEIFTPSLASPVTEKTRAYGGWIGASLHTDIRYETLVHRVSISAGFVGAPSLAGPSQRLLHQLIGSRAPIGWNSQLATEPTLDLGYSGAVDVLGARLSSHVRGRLSPTWNLTVGTAHRDAGIGLQGVVEFGAEGVSRWRDTTSDRSGLYMIGAVRERGVAGDLFLDGGFFRREKSVGHRRYVTVTELGFGALVHGRGLEWRFVQSARQYRVQARPHAYVTLALIR